ncbi:cytochrome C biogenesis protein [Microbulbifer agarilyticus]|uniref:Cytochrome C biogenesis protein n=1 Tax=Microbulbifer agarilyticus TaxID=260552 RepID=A0A1Q2M8B5_9GAMM|nr:protein-disulfide reductase DsbD [Microbulbifer agarilyticus]AQQ68926.1 cytochrome C biogenesis protein [Microbulbifer agarilyticus]
MTANTSGMREIYPHNPLNTRRSPLNQLGAAMALLAALLCSVLLSAPASAQQENPFAALSGGQDDFLPVDEAYQLDVLLNDTDAAALFQIAPEYYLYRDKLSVYLLNGEDKTELPLTLQSGEVIWDDYFEKETEVYRWQLEVPLALPAGSSKARLQVNYQGCADAGLCYPPQTRNFDLDLLQKTATPVEGSGGLGSGPSGAASGSSAPLAGSASSTLFSNLLLAMALAFGGGMLLNLMPCVFPVLSIKALTITNSGDRQQLHGWAYTAGVVATFLLIAALMLGLRAAGEAVGWGFQLQSPVVVAALAYLFFAMGLSLSGLTEFGGRLMGLGANSESKGLSGSFSTGALATVVASPCTAPMMGSALGFAVTQPAPVALAVFAALGFGMAAPFLLLTYIPALAQRLPRPGPWMETLKQLLAFPMYLTAVWLLWVLGRQSGSDGVTLVLAGAVAIAFALWLWPRPATTGKTWLRTSTAVIAVAGAIWVLPNLDSNAGQPTQANKSDYWQTYSPEALAAARSEGRPVLINMTAAWCITCLANEKVVLSSDRITAAVEDLGITALKGDWTNQDPQITELLARYGRSSVPLYLLFPEGGGEPQILPQILTRDGLLTAMHSAVSEERLAESTSR